MSSSLKKVVGTASLVAVFGIGFGAPAQAALLERYLIPGTINFSEDNSREAFSDVDASGTFSTGHVRLSYLRVENRSGPSAPDLGNTTYAIFSQHIASATGAIVEFAPTTAVGLRLSDMVAGPESNAMVALYTTNYATDLILTNPGRIAGAGGITRSDYLAFIATKSLELTAGIDATTDDFFNAILSLGFVPTTAQIAAMDTSTSVAFFGAAVSILTRNAFNFGDVCTNFVHVVGCSDLTLVSGNVGGAGNAANEEFKDRREFPFVRCGTGGGCGFIDNTDINLLPVPEPPSMILFGFGLTANGSYDRRARNCRVAEQDIHHTSLNLPTPSKPLLT